MNDDVKPGKDIGPNGDLVTECSLTFVFSRSLGFSTKLEGRILSPFIQVWFFPLNRPVQKSSNLTWTERINFHWNFLMIFNPNKPLELFMDTSVFVPKSSFWAPSFLGSCTSWRVPGNLRWAGFILLILDRNFDAGWWEVCPGRGLNPYQCGQNIIINTKKQGPSWTFINQLWTNLFRPGVSTWLWDSVFEWSSPYAYILQFEFFCFEACHVVKKKQSEIYRGVLGILELDVKLWAYFFRGRTRIFDYR